MKKAIICFLIVSYCLIAFCKTSSTATHEAFARNVVEFIDNQDIHQNETHEYYFNLLRKEGIEPKGGFQEGRELDVEESIQLLGNLIAKEKQNEKKLDATLVLKYRNRVTLLQIKGKVQIKLENDEKWINASVDSALTESTLLKTSKDSWAKLKIGMLGYILLREDSLLDLRKLRVKKNGIDEDIFLHLDQGKMLVNVQGMSKQSDFNTSTPSTLVAVRGTIYEVSAD